MTRVQLTIPLREIPFVVRTEELEPPFEFKDLFGRSGPVEMEIGCGKGLFLVRAAEQNPETNYIGVEKAGKYFRRAVDRIHKAGHTSIRMLNGDAFDVLSRWTPPRSLDAVHVYFPDPWPKARHARRRLLQPTLFRLIAEVLPNGQPFRLGSDVGPYFEQAVLDVLATGAFEQVAWPGDALDRLPTSYAIKYAQEGRPLHYAKFLRNSRPLVEGDNAP